MSRRSARKHVFNLLFQLDFYKDDFQSAKEIYLEENAASQEDVEFILDEVEGAIKHLEEIDALIDKCAKDWSIERLSKVDLAILRLAVFEMKYSENIPVSVAANEAVELAKTYSEEEAPAFINGILGQVSKI